MAQPLRGDVTNTTGHTGRWVFASRRKQPYSRKTAGDAVIIVPILAAKGSRTGLVLIKEFRVPVGDYIHAFPAGLLETGEKIEQAVRREMLEETGLEVQRFKRITPALYSTSGLTDESAADGVRRCPRRAGRNKPSKEERTSRCCCSTMPRCASCATDAGCALDAKAWTILYMYQQLGRLERHFSLCRRGARGEIFKRGWPRPRGALAWRRDHDRSCRSSIRPCRRP